MLLDSSFEVSSIINMEAEMASEAEVAYTEGWIIYMNSGHIVRVEGNKCDGLQLASSIRNPYESSIHSSKSSISGRSSGAGSQWDKPSVAV
jgi:hypothetical protein